ncbi:MAG: chemotaxis protein CheX [Treponema sp.]|nr:chemotaxis protein CheX [Treponema sp.]
MDIQINALLMKACKDIFMEIGFSNIEIEQGQKAVIKASRHKAAQNSEKNDILALIGLVGTLKGQLILAFPPTISDSFVSQLVSNLGMDAEQSHQFNKEAIAELSNQIGGAFVNLLSQKGVDCMITPPVILSGSGVQAMLPESDKDYFFDVSGDFGYFTCIFAIKSSKLI